MNEEDRRMSETEREAEPERFGTEEVEQPPMPHRKADRRQILSRQVTSSTNSGSTSSGEGIEREEIAVSRMTTQHEAAFDLERHPTALSRIQTARSQHSQTIGAGLRSRTVSKQSKKPLPNFGGGKPYPPNLPDREEYVVEFDGPDDPIHAQNW